MRSFTHSHHTFQFMIENVQLRQLIWLFTTIYPVFNDNAVLEMLSCFISDIPHDMNKTGRCHTAGQRRDWSSHGSRAAGEPAKTQPGKHATLCFKVTLRQYVYVVVICYIFWFCLFMHICESHQTSFFKSVQMPNIYSQTCLLKDLRVVMPVELKLIVWN